VIKIEMPQEGRGGGSEKLKKCHVLFESPLTLSMRDATCLDKPTGTDFHHPNNFRRRLSVCI
jgi:hypothetical protein